MGRWYEEKKIECMARAIYKVRPDCHGKEWPIKTEQDRRAYPHNPIAAVDLCYAYANAALEAARLYDRARIKELKGDDTTDS